MDVDWKSVEERGARWANMISLILGFYCAYVIWNQRHSDSASLISYPAFIFALIAFVICLAIGGILNFLRRDRKEEAAAQPIPENRAPVKTTEVSESHAPSRLKIISAHYGVEGINKPEVTHHLLKRL